MTLFLLTLAATGCLLAGVGLGYYLGHSDGYDRGWVARSYAREPRWLELVRDDDDRVFNFTSPEFDDSSWGGSDAVPITIRDRREPADG